MRIIRADCYEVQIPFRFSFKHALAERRRADSALINITLENGVDGWGESAPRKYLTGETVDSVLADWRDWFSELRQIDFTAATPLPQLFTLYEHADAHRKTSAYGAIEIALIDALAKTAEKNAADFLSLPSRNVNLTAPLGAIRGAKLRWLTRLFYWLGNRDFKLKVGMSADDFSRIREIKKIIGDGDLRVDANAAWDLATAEKICEKFSPQVSSIEQPVATIEDFAELKKRVACRLMADESLCTRRDAEMLGKFGGADLWNLRLGKIGGFNGLFAMIALAKNFGADLHLGALVGETALLSNAGRIASSAANFAHIEYGFSRLLLKDDPFRGGVAGYFGTGKPLAKSARGFGVRVLPKMLEKITVRKFSCS